MIRMLLLVAITAIGSASCVRLEPKPGTSLVEVAGDWRLDHGTIDGVAIPIVEGADITLTMEAPSIVGTSACNSWGGRLALVASEIRVTDITTTDMRCADDVMASESAFMRAITRVGAAEREGDRLTLLGPGVELVLSAR